MANAPKTARKAAQTAKESLTESEVSRETPNAAQRASTDDLGAWEKAYLARIEKWLADPANANWSLSRIWDDVTGSPRMAGRHDWHLSFDFPATVAVIGIGKVGGERPPVPISPQLAYEFLSPENYRQGWRVTDEKDAEIAPRPEEVTDGNT